MEQGFQIPARTACSAGGETQTNLSGQAEIINKGTKTATDAAAADSSGETGTEQTATPASEGLPQTADSTSASEQEQSPVDEYFFVAPDGTKLRAAAMALQYEEFLAASMENTVAPSCAFDGEDKVYIYDGFEVQAGALGGVDYLTGIIINDDSVATPEGVKIGSTLTEMVNLYGDDYEEVYGQYIYEDDEVQFIVIIDMAEEKFSALAILASFQNLSRINAWFSVQPHLFCCSCRSST